MRNYTKKTKNVRYAWTQKMDFLKSIHKEVKNARRAKRDAERGLFWALEGFEA